jgi:hypothetical protein
MSQDRGFKKSHGFNQDDEMENPRGQVGPDDHGWAPDSDGGQPEKALAESDAEERREVNDR